MQTEFKEATTMPKTATIAYEPETWNAAQREMHEVANLDDAMRNASCLAGGWYRRPVSVDGKICGSGERYSLRPSDVSVPHGWTRYYTIDAHAGER